MAGQKAKRRSKTMRQFRVHALGIHPFCKWCQCPLTLGSATTDHVIPLSRGGSNDWANLCLACWSCNQKRKNYLPGEEPSGPLTGRPAKSKHAAGKQPAWVAWTRYPGGRWRPTFPGSCLVALRHKAQRLMGETGEVVILLKGREPGEGIPDVWVI